MAGKRQKNPAPGRCSADDTATVSNPTISDSKRPAVNDSIATQCEISEKLKKLRGNRAILLAKQAEKEHLTDPEGQGKGQQDERPLGEIEKKRKQSQQGERGERAAAESAEAGGNHRPQNRVRPVATDKEKAKTYGSNEDVEMIKLTKPKKKALVVSSEPKPDGKDSAVPKAATVVTISSDANLSDDVALLSNVPQPFKIGKPLKIGQPVRKKRKRVSDSTELKESSDAMAEQLAKLQEGFSQLEKKALERAQVEQVLRAELEALRQEVARLRALQSKILSAIVGAVKAVGDAGLGGGSSGVSDPPAE